DNGFIISGYQTIMNGNSIQAILLRTDSIGNIIWTRSYKGASNTYGRGALQINDGGFVSSFIYPIGGVFLIKVDANGDSLWSKGFCGIIYSNTIDKTSDHGFVISGYDNSRGMIIKTDSLGSGGCIDVIDTIIVGTPIFSNVNFTPG